MKTIYHFILALSLTGVLSSCEKFLDSEPQSTISPEVYFTDASHLQAYTDEMYSRILPGDQYGYYRTDDRYTDNQIQPSAPDYYFEGQWKVPHDGGDWSFEIIYRLNSFFANVLPRYGEDLNGSQNTITGTLADIQHYIGEMYTLRALEYFKRYQKFGDFPIITEPLKDDETTLIEASKRMPRNEVARFIISDLDKAISLLSSTNKETTRLNKDVALLIKSRVALYEGTWLKYFKGTAFVPNGEGWPGKSKGYNADYQFPTGSIDNEIEWFLEQSMIASKEIAEKYKGNLTQNTGLVQQSINDPSNPYYDMFASEDLSLYPEVLLWKQYTTGIAMHGGCVGANQGNWATGVTRSLVQNFLMKDGKPVYAHSNSYTEAGNLYMGDKTIKNVCMNRDTRLSIFLKIPGQKNILIGTPAKGDIFITEPYPKIVDGAEQLRATTGYLLRKGGAFDSKHYTDVWAGYTGFVVFRAAEALLNYMEASYEKEGILNESAREYWKILRRRALISDDIDATIKATNMKKEAENDWGAYSKGNILTDATLYNIRRERRSEFLSEGLRFMDLHRWRAMDQLITTPYIPQGIHLWNTPMEEWYIGELKADGSADANVSSSTDYKSGEYLTPYRCTNTQRCYEGYVWKMAHYLDPINMKQFLITSSDGSSIETSPIYQNPYWPTTADMPAEK